MPPRPKAPQKPVQSIQHNSVRMGPSSWTWCLDDAPGLTDFPASEPAHIYSPLTAQGRNYTGEELYLAKCSRCHQNEEYQNRVNQQNGFEINLIALHIRCEEVWPRNWSPIPPDRTHRPSLLLISDTDDDKTSWVVEAAKAFLPQCGGSYNKVFKICNLNNTE